MARQDFDLIVRGGTVATDTDVFEADVGVVGGQVAAIGKSLGAGRQEVDAKGKLVLPGGVDSHAHIEQISSNGLLGADDWESGTTAAAFGGTTTVIAFAAQHKGMNLEKVVDDYSRLARKGAVIDYTFHLIIADPTPETLQDHLPKLLAEGHNSIKLFMTYDLLNVDDTSILETLSIARRFGANVSFHAENYGMITWATRHLLAAGKVHPRYHADSHPRLAEIEAIGRVIRLSEMVDQPIVIFHVSTAEGAAVIRDARARGVSVSAETCPQYLLLTREELDKPGLEGAKWMCSPPLREAADQDALWHALRLRDLQLVTSDHAPYRFDETGKLRNGPRATFKQIGNGMPGIEVRLPLLFDAMVSKERFDLRRFVELTSTAPAKLYGLHPRKGTVAIGADADLVVWDPDRSVTITKSILHDRTDYTPYEGHRVRGWPETIIRRGEVIIQGGSLAAEPGSGRYVRPARAARAHSL